MSKRPDYQFSKPQSGAKVFWTSLEDKDAPEAAAKRAKSELPEGIGDAWQER